MSAGGHRWQTVGMRVASVQFSATTDVVANLETIAPLVREAGRQGAELIVAVNTDPGAAIFQIAHYGAVADLFDIVDELTELLG